MKNPILLTVLITALVLTLSAGFGWAAPPIDQPMADSAIIAANGYGPGNGSGNGGGGPMDGTGHGPGDCSIQHTVNGSVKALQVRHGGGRGQGHGHGPGNGNGNGGNGPRDGSGNGPGDCTGPIGS